jgi:hypothetical protein
MALKSGKPVPSSRTTLVVLNGAAGPAAVTTGVSPGSRVKLPIASPLAVAMLYAAGAEPFSAAASTARGGTRHTTFAGVSTSGCERDTFARA